MDVKQSLEMISMERPHRRIRTLVDQYLSNYTTQRLDVIDKLFRVYGIANLTKNAQGLSGKKKLLKNVEASVSRRNEIAHAGDYNSHDKLQEIARDKTEKQIGNIKLFVEKSEELIFKIIK